MSIVHAALVVAAALLVLALVPAVVAHRRRTAAIALLQHRQPKLWQFLEREGGRQRLLKWTEQDPDAVDDDVLREALQGTQRVEKVSRRLAGAALVIALVALFVFGDNNPNIDRFALPRR